MEALAQFTASAVDALAKEGFCVIQLPLSLGNPRGLDPLLMPAFLCEKWRGKYDVFRIRIRENCYLNWWMLSRPETFQEETTKSLTPPKTNMTMEKTTMNEDVFPIENGDFPMSC